MLKGVTFENQNVTSANDGALYEQLFTDGILWGCSMSYTATGLTIQPGQMIIGGRMLYIDGATTYDATDIIADGYGQLVLTIDLSQPSTQTNFQRAQATWVYSTTSTFPALTQEAINETGTVYQQELAVVSVSGGNITGITQQIGSSVSTAQVYADDTFLRLYTSLESIGCSTASSLEDVYRALPLQTQLILHWCGSSVPGYAGTTFGNSLPWTYGTLTVRKSDVCEFEFRRYVGSNNFPIVSLKYANNANDVYSESEWEQNITTDVSKPTFASTPGLNTVYEGTIAVTGNIVSLFLRGNFKTAAADTVVATLPSTVPLPSVRPHVTILNHSNATVSGIAWIDGRNIVVSGIATAGHYSITMTYIGE